MIDNTNYLNPSLMPMDISSSSNYPMFSEERFEPCRVCGEQSSGWHCGAVTCEACKKFFLRSINGEDTKYKCVRNKDCVIDRATRTQCQYCRFKKCKEVGMTIHENPNNPTIAELFKGFACQVCTAPSSGVHFGAVTCEGCKGFFRRSIKERAPERYKCMDHGNCEVSVATRNMCRFCRFQRCLSAGMSAHNSRIGRQSNLFKHRIIELQRNGGVPNSEYLNIAQRKTKSYKTNKGISSDGSVYIKSEYLQTNEFYQQNNILNSSISNNYHVDSKLDVKSEILLTSYDNSTQYNTNYYYPNNLQHSQICQPQAHQQQQQQQPNNQLFLANQPTIPVIQFNQVSIEMLFDENTTNMINFLKASYIRLKYEILGTSNEYQQSINQSRSFHTTNSLINSINYDNDTEIVLDILTNYALKFTKYVDCIPDIVTMKPEDKSTLIKGSIHSVILLILQQECKYFNYFNSDDILHQKLIKLFPIFSECNNLLKIWNDFFRNSQLDDIEYALFLPVLIFSIGHQNLIDFKKILETKEKFYEYLEQYVMARRNKYDVSKEIMLFTTDMRQTNYLLSNGIVENIQCLLRKDINTIRSFNCFTRIFLPKNMTLQD